MERDHGTIHVNMTHCRWAWHPISGYDTLQTWQSRWRMRFTNKHITLKWKSHVISQQDTLQFSRIRYKSATHTHNKWARHATKQRDSLHISRTRSSGASKSQPLNSSPPVLYASTSAVISWVNVYFWELSSSDDTNRRKESRLYGNYLWYMVYLHTCRASWFPYVASVPRKSLGSAGWYMASNIMVITQMGPKIIM